MTISLIRPSNSLRILTRMASSKAPYSASPDPSILSTLVQSRGWSQKNERSSTDGGEERSVLHKDYKLRNFKEAWAFMGVIADKAEELNHHPEWSNVYNKVSITLTTHSKNSTITSLDTSLAQACEDAYDGVIAQRPPKKPKAGNV